MTNISLPRRIQDLPDPLLPEGLVNDEGDLPKAVVQVVKTFAEKFLEIYEQCLSDDLVGKLPGWECMWYPVLSRVCKDLEALDDPAETIPPVEKTVAEIIRSGVPQQAVKVTYKNLVLTLTNIKYRFRRDGTGNPVSFMVMNPGLSPFVQTTLSSGRFAALLLAVDTAMPDIRQVMDGLQEGMRNAGLEYQARRKAEEIERLTVRRLLDMTLDPMNINGHFEVKDGVVHLTLTKTLKADLDIPMERLREFLSDPEGIESTLVPQKIEELFGDSDPSMYI